MLINCICYEVAKKGAITELLAPIPSQSNVIGEVKLNRLSFDLNYCLLPLTTLLEDLVLPGIIKFQNSYFNTCHAPTIINSRQKHSLKISKVIVLVLSFEKCF